MNHPPSGHGYEFGPVEDLVFTDAARWLKVLGIIEIVSGCLNLVGKSWVNAALNITVGVLMLGAAAPLRAIPATQGNDIGNLMDALRRVRTVLIVRTVITLVASTLAIVLLVIAFEQLRHLMR